jgi:hypothetical protein
MAIKLKKSMEYSPMEIFTCGPLIIGLNNQKMCLIGLFSEAEKNGALVRLPETFVDFTPRADRRKGEDFSIWDLFDRAKLESVCAGRLTAEAATKTLRAAELFSIGGLAIKLSSPQMFPARFILGAVAAAPLQAVAEEVLNWLSGRQAIALQLRIERDWQESSLRKLPPGSPHPPWLDPDWIFQKIEATFNSGVRSSVYACCDEDDLTIDIDTLRSIAKKRNIDLIFKRDLPNSIRFPNFVTQRAMIDYTICRNLPTYIGLMQSSFSRMIYISSRLENKNQNLFRYDRPDSLLYSI